MIKLTSLLFEEISVDEKIRKVSILERALQLKYNKYLEDLMFYYDDSINGIFLSDLYIKNQYKGQGYGTKIMNELIKFADIYNMAISLIPVSENTSSEKLIEFYKKFGFIENEGNPLFDDMSMYRLPQKF